MAVVRGDAGGCPHSKKPFRQSQSDQESLQEGPWKKQSWRERLNCPSETAAVVNLDEMPPLEEDEAIVELDAAIDKAGDEGEEGPEPLDEVDIREVARHIKDDPMLHLALGLTEPYWTSMALVVGVQKLQEYEALKNNWRRSQVLSYGRLAACYNVRKDQLQEVSVVGKVQQRSKEHRARQDERVVVFKQRPESEGYPTTSQQDAP